MVGNANAALDFDDKIVDNAVDVVAVVVAVVMIVVDDQCYYESSNASVDSFCSDERKRKKKN